MDQIFHIINEMSPYLLLGFFFGGLLHAFVPSAVYSRYLSRPNFRSVVMAALFGIPLPLCSCGVIPTAMSLRKEGASKGATTAFLIATPQTGVDSIMASYGLLGLPFAIVRPIAALVTSLFGGALSNRLSDNERSECPAANTSAPTVQQVSFGYRVLDALRFAFYDMVNSIGKWLLIGLVVAGLITVLIPDSAFQMFQGNTLASMLLVLCIAVPMYVCATGSIPIAVSLMIKGLTPGAGLVLLMAGPACSVASMLVVKKVLGTKSLLIYLFSIIVGSIGFGCLVDFLHFGGVVNFTGSLVMQGTADCSSHGDGWFAWTCSVVLLALVANALILPHILNKTKKKSEEMNQNSKTYVIKDVDCAHCKAAAERAIMSVAGVESVEVTIKSGLTVIKGTPNYEDLKKALADVGFTLGNL